LWSDEGVQSAGWSTWWKRFASKTEIQSAHVTNDGGSTDLIGLLESAKTSHLDCGGLGGDGTSKAREQPDLLFYLVDVGQYIYILSC
jgi:hypothetical protein